ncbi:MAG TPA: Gfo/Idh/MocA family oxidoreductase, partial [Candidatus Hydrogenedentes bacterium]|nr:Gfo/Idh/MocA family oxidoreductase [Candidatus Hydrogenedentota bacterium]
MHHEHQASRMNRRAFLRNTAAAAMAAGVVGHSGRAFPARERLGVGVIGVGGRGNSHLQAMKHIQNKEGTVRITAVCDVYRPRLEKAAKAYDAKGYMDHRELLADPNVDIVCIATPDHHHGFQAIDAVRAGKDVYCEKPVTHWRQFELTKQLAREVKQSGRTFQCGTQGMSDAAWRQMSALVKDGIIGQPIHAEAGFFRVGDWGE